MNNAITVPLTSDDQAAMAAALSSPQSNGAAAKNAALKTIYQVVSNSQAFGITSADICQAVGEGSSSTGDEALFEGLSFFLSYIGSWGVLIILAAGIIQMMSWLEELASWFITAIKSAASITSALSSAENLLTHPLSTILSWAGLTSSSSSSTSSDTINTTNTGSMSLSALLMMAGAQAPTLSMLTNVFGTASGQLSSTPSGGGSNGGGFNGSYPQPPPRHLPLRKATYGGGIKQANPARTGFQGAGASRNGSQQSNPGSQPGKATFTQAAYKQSQSPSQTPSKSQTPAKSGTGQGQTGTPSSTGQSSPTQNQSPTNNPGTPTSSGSGSASGGSSGYDRFPARRRDFGVRASRPFVRMGRR